MSLELDDATPDKRAEVIALAIALASEDETGVYSWRSIDAAAARDLRFWEANGYELSHVERLAAGYDDEGSNEPNRGQPIPPRSRLLSSAGKSPSAVRHRSRARRRQDRPGHYFLEACDRWVVEYDPGDCLAFGYASRGHRQDAE